MELRHHDALGTVYHKGALLGHVRYLSQVDVLYLGGEVLVVGVGAVKLKFGFQGHRVGEATLKTLLDGITWGIDVIVEKLEYEVVAGVGYREVFGKDLVQTFIVALLGRSIELEEVAERLQLHLEKVRIRKRILYRRKANAFVI